MSQDSSKRGALIAVALEAAIGLLLVFPPSFTQSMPSVRGGSNGGTRSATLILHYQLTDRVSSGGRTETWHHTLDTSILMSMANMDYPLDGVEYIFEYADQSGRLTTLPAETLPGMSPHDFKVVSLTGQATYSYEGHDSCSDAHQHGEGKLDPATASFVVRFKDDKFFADVSSGEFPVTGETKHSCGSGGTDVEPPMPTAITTGNQFPYLATPADWTVGITRATRNGIHYTGNAQYTHSHPKGDTSIFIEALFDLGGGGQPPTPPSTPPKPDQPQLPTGSVTILASSFNPSGSGQPVTFTATVKSVTGIGTPTGKVSFNDGATTLDTETLDSKGQAIYKSSALAIGLHRMMAIYSGDSDFQSSVSPVLMQVVSAISLTPTSLTFGAQSLGVTSPPQIITLTNHGSAAVRLDSVRITGMNQTTFAIASSTCGNTLPAGLTCALSITFVPRTRGELRADLSISDDAQGSPQQASLMGTAR